MLWTEDARRASPPLSSELSAVQTVEAQVSTYGYTENFRNNATTEKPKFFSPIDFLPDDVREAEIANTGIARVRCVCEFHP
jgi:hypothetical protein